MSIISFFKKLFKREPTPRVPGIRGDVPDDIIDMAYETIHEAYKHLHKTGKYPKVQPYDGWDLELKQVPYQHEWNLLKNSSNAHATIFHAVAFQDFRVEWKGKIKYWTLVHEMKHILMYRAGYLHDSHNHLPPAFEAGGYVMN